MNRLVTIVLAPMFVAALGCSVQSASPESGQDPFERETTGEASLELTTVPGAALCIKVVAAGAAQTVTRLLPVTPGTSSAALALGQLPLGSVSFTGQAFDVACDAPTFATAVPSWVADPLTATLKVGVVTPIVLNFRRNNPVTGSANFLDNVAGIAAGGDSTFALMADGTVKAWGGLNYGSGVPTTVAGLAGVVEIVAGDLHACARIKDGTVKCWGLNGNGQVGTGSTTPSYVYSPVTVAGINGATSIAAGANHTCALTGSQIWCWGLNNHGQLGNGTTTDSPKPVALPGGWAVVRVYAGGNRSCMINGVVYCWGENGSGQLGSGDTVDHLTIAAVNTPGSVALALGASHGCSLRADGLVRCWGANWYGQLGDGTTTSHNTPAAVPGITDATSVAVGRNHTCVRVKNGTVKCWGFNGGGEVGDGTGDGKTVPTLVSGLTGVSDVHAGADYTCSAMDDLSVRCWGENSAGQLGDGTTEDAFLPVRVVMQ